MNDLSQFFAIQDVPGHLAYIILAVSYYVTSILWLRMLAIVGIALEGAYFMLTSPELYAGIAWSAIFIAINAYQLFWLIRDRLSLRLPPAEKAALRRVLAGLGDVQIARLLKASQWRDIEARATLTKENQNVDELYFLFAGRAVVDVGGRQVAHLESGSFVGEVAFLTAQKATATVTIMEQSRILAMSREKLTQLCKTDEQVAGAVYQLLGRDLAAKLRRSNGTRAAQPLTG